MNKGENMHTAQMRLRWERLRYPERWVVNGKLQRLSFWRWLLAKDKRVQW